MRSELQELRRVVDIELTNRCNARCSFCPRDETPEQGFMTFEVFKKAIARVEELEVMPEVNSAGQGDSLLHPQLIEFSRYVQERGIPYSITTNAALLTKEKAQQLLDTDLAKINFSIGDLYGDYEEVYSLNFDNTRNNIMNFLDVNAGKKNPCEIIINVVKHDINKDKIEEVKAYWRKAGVNTFLVFDQSNRGGACDNGHYFQGNDKYEKEAKALFQETDLSPLCAAAFLYLFVGWNGNYYVCCNDYKKTTILSNVFDHRIDEVDVMKKELMWEKNSIEACINCNLDPTNIVRETLFEIEHGEETNEKIVNFLNAQKSSQAILPKWMTPTYSK